MRCETDLTKKDYRLLSKKETNIEKTHEQVMTKIEQDFYIYS